MEVKGRKVLVFGAGISGIGAAGLLEANGADVILYDGNEKLDPASLKEQLGEKSSAAVLTGKLPQETITSLDMAVLSPGVPTDLPVVLAMKEAGVQVIGEIELAYQFGKGDVLAITGTNGKTTTTSLLGQIMKQAREEVYVVGNIGNPYTAVAGQMTEQAVTVAEISSFQLETIREFRPKVSAILNITPDHLNRHHTMEAYIEAKENIAVNQTEDDFCILNYEDRLLREFGENLRAKVLYFSSQRKLEEGIFLEDGGIVLCLNGQKHRIEYVAEKNGVAYYNDSKGTNPDAAIKGIRAMKRPTVLIGGGYDKDSEYTEWIESFDGKVKKLILLGQTREKIARDAKKCGFTDYVFADSFEEAVHMAVKEAVSGDAVLLSPACASWDMFPSYEVRGDKFKEIVNSL